MFVPNPNEVEEVCKDIVSKTGAPLARGYRRRGEIVFDTCPICRGYINREGWEHDPSKKKATPENPDKETFWINEKTGKWCCQRASCPGINGKRGGTLVELAAHYKIELHDQKRYEEEHGIGRYRQDGPRPVRREAPQPAPPPPPQPEPAAPKHIYKYTEPVITTPAPDYVIRWAASRKISPEALELYHVAGDTGKESGRIIWQHLDPSGTECLFRRYRTIDKDGKTIKKGLTDTAWTEKTLGPKMKPGDILVPYLFGMHVANPENGLLVVVEGEPDALACYTAGVRNAVSIPAGVSNWRWIRDNPQAGDWVRKFPGILIFGDQDVPGEISMTKEFKHYFPDMRLFKVKPEEYGTHVNAEGKTVLNKDANDILIHAGPKRLYELVCGAENLEEIDMKEKENTAPATDISQQMALQETPPPAPTQPTQIPAPPPTPAPPPQPIGPIVPMRLMESYMATEPAEVKYYTTGIAALDKAVAGLQLGELVVVAGKAGEGKTTLLCNTIANILDDGLRIKHADGTITAEAARVALYSGEMTAGMVSDWIINQFAGDNVTAQRDEFENVKYRVRPEIREAIIRYYSGRLMIYDGLIGTGENENETARILWSLEQAISWGANCIIVDNLMSALDLSENADTNTAQTNFVKKLVMMANRYKVLVILAVHPRKMEGAITSLSDICGSSNIGNLASTVISVNRVSEAEADGYNSKLVVIKSRRNGEVRGQEINAHYHKQSRQLLGDIISGPDAEVVTEAYKRTARRYRWEDKPEKAPF